ncbi:MAG TPA: zinc ABC transporter substrate-binding protein [Acidimicrobiales bacterium]|nr:zinc ABC transporter substrate-binding protein [Acidimicrobiales bacterium]
MPGSPTSAAGGTDPRRPTRRLSPRRGLALALAGVAGAALALGLGLASAAPAVSSTGATSQAGARRRPGTVVQVVAAENFWGSIAAQVGGIHVDVHSIITNPNTDPHSYEPTPADARSIATAQLVIVNGVGYDPWAPELLAADAGTSTVLTVGSLLGLKNGDNPHRWYDPADVRRVAAAIAADLGGIDHGDAAYFTAQARHFTTVALATENRLIAEIRAKYAGTPVGASESIFSVLAPSLGLRLVTPGAFLKAISEGTEVSAGDKATADRQISHHLIKIYVYNSQNTTPDIQAQLAECKASHVPTATITETLVPPTATYEAWQASQLRGILAALQKAAAA